MKFINIGLIASISFFSCVPHSTLMTNKGIPSIKSKINKLIAESDLGVSIGIKVISVEDGKTLYELNSNKLFIPASNNKLYTCVAALHYLGRDHTFKTTILKNNYQYSVFVLDTNSWLIYLEGKLSIFGILQRKEASEKFKL